MDDNALKMSLPRNCLETGDPDSDNIWMTGLMDKYKARPATPEFEGMCMVDFASKYRLVYGRQKDGKNVIPLQDEMDSFRRGQKAKMQLSGMHTSRKRRILKSTTGLY